MSERRYSVLVTKRIRYVVQAQTPDEAHQLAILAALGEEAARATGRVAVMTKVLEADLPESLDADPASIVES